MSFGDERPTMSWIERTLIPGVRRHAGRSYLFAISTVAIGAGLLDASGYKLPLGAYVLAALLLFAASFVSANILGFRRRNWIFGLLYPAPDLRDEDNLPVYRNLRGSTEGAPLRTVAATRRVDHFYELGLRCLLDADRPLALVPSSLGDIPNTEQLLFPIHDATAGRSDCSVDPGDHGVCLPPYDFRRHVPAGDADHPLRVRDIVHLPLLAHVLGFFDSNGRGEREPFIVPEHSVDLALVEQHDVFIIGGGDSNFWHPALFELIWRQFEPSRGKSSVPIGLSMRQQVDGKGLYDSREIHSRQVGRRTMPHAVDRGEYTVFEEKSLPTYAMITAFENPVARAAGKRRLCVFIAGTRSLGTSGAVLAAALMIRTMRASPQQAFSTRIETADPRVMSEVSSVLCRVAEAEHPSYRRRAARVPRGVNQLPAFGPDEHYTDTYIPIRVEWWDNLGQQPSWRPVG